VRPEKKRQIARRLMPFAPNAKRHHQAVLQRMQRTGASKLALETMLNELLRYGARTELSAASPNPRAVNELSTRFSRPQRRRQAGGPQLSSRTSKRTNTRRVMPESGKE